MVNNKPDSEGLRVFAGLGLSLLGKAMSNRRTFWNVMGRIDGNADSVCVSEFILSSFCQGSVVPLFQGFLLRRTMFETGNGHVALAIKIATRLNHD